MLIKVFDVNQKHKGNLDSNKVEFFSRGKDKETGKWFVRLSMISGTTYQTWFNEECNMLVLYIDLKRQFNGEG